MSTLESPTPPQADIEIRSQLQMLVDAQRGTEVATLTAAVIAAMGRPVSIAEAMDIRQDIFFSLYMGHNQTRYREWAATKTERLAVVRT